jgi:hypothetical protein
LTMRGDFITANGYEDYTSRVRHRLIPFVW